MHVIVIWSYDHSIVQLDYCYYIVTVMVSAWYHISLHAATPQPPVTQERGHAGATTQDLTLDEIFGHCESWRPFNVVIAPQVIFVCTRNYVTKFVKRDCIPQTLVFGYWAVPLANPVTYHVLSILMHTYPNHLQFLLFTLLFAATPRPPINEEIGQVGGAAQESAKEDVSQHCEPYLYSPQCC